MMTPTTVLVIWLLLILQLSQSARNNPPPGVAACRNIPGLSRQQLTLCKRRGADTAAALEGLRYAVAECQHQFRFSRWNCSSLSQRKLMGSAFLQRGYRESAFAHAISSAGVVHSVARACSQGRLVSCGCAASTGHHRKGLTGTQRWKWGGCGHDIHYGVEFSTMFLDTKEQGDIRDRIAGHNNQAGRLAVANNMQVRCKCHGMSGSCELKTCWKTAPDFRRIGKTLKNRFRSALLVDQSNLGNGSPIIITSKPRIRKQDLKPRARTKEKIKKRKKNKRDISTELLYYQKSPNFCEKDLAMDVLGTSGRVCNRTSEGSNGCATLCCGRGYNMVKRRRSERCNCKFHWCCKVECESCIIEEWIPICK